MLESDFDIDGFLARPLFAHLATLGESGPCDSPVWFLWELGALWIISDSKSSLPKRLMAEPRCAVNILDFDLERGFLQQVGMRGSASILASDGARLERLVCRYLGAKETWNPWFQGNVIARQDVLVRFEPATVVARDQSYFKNGPRPSTRARPSG